MSTKDRSTLLADLLTAFPNNTIGSITPAILRSQQTDIIDSFLNLIDDQVIPPDVVFVTSADDFPAPIGGISTLEEKTYLISVAGVISIPFRIKFAFSRTIITGLGRLFSTLEFNNVSASDANIINDSDISVTVTDTIIHSPNAPMFDCVGGSNSLFTISDSVLDECADLGKVDGFIRNQVNNGTLIGFNVTGGLEFLGSNGTIIIQDVQSAANSATPTFIMTDAGFTCTNLNLSNITATLLTGTNQFADIDPTKVTGGLVADSAFSSTDPVGADINNTTPNFIIDRVAGIEPTRKIGSVSRAPGTIAIALQSTPVEIGGSWLGANLSQFSALNPGIQYDGIPGQDIFQVSGAVSGSKAGATGSDIYTCAIYKNDILIADSLDISEISDKGGSFLMNTFTALTTNDHITLYISNEDSDEDFDLTDAKISVHRVF